jgi:hypothetical protein
MIAHPLVSTALDRLCHSHTVLLVSRRCVLPDMPVLASLLPHLADLLP